KLGDDYVKRNFDKLYLRAKFWGEIKRKYKPKKILEIGCGDGRNLQFLMTEYFGKGLNGSVDSIGPYGIDVNKRSIKLAQDIRLGVAFNVIYGSATDIPFKDNFFDLVFTAGLLIHIPPKDIKKAMEEIIRVSNKYVLAIEYYANEERERPFLGKLGITWERPYKNMYVIDEGLKLLEEGFLTREDGFNDLHYQVFEKEEKCLLSFKPGWDQQGCRTKYYKR
ncbi:hypothetical protein LCGC14_2861720, partial [marine sediment metagenome]